MILHNSAVVFGLSGLILGVTCSILILFLSIYGKAKLHRIWVLFNVAVAVWGYGSYFIANASNEREALIVWKIAFSGVLFIAVFFYHVACLFCQIKRFKTILFAYLQGFLFFILSFSNLYISEVFLLGGDFYYLKAKGALFILSCFLWVFFVALGLIELIIHFRKLKDVRRAQTLYLFLGFGVGFLGGITNFFPLFGIGMIPFGNVTIPIYCIVVTYAILKYRLVDIKLVITRASIFIFVYTLVLGVPFWVGFRLLGIGIWLLPAILMGFFATIGPFIYLYVQKRAEDRLLQEQRRYQTTLRQASAGMGRIKDLKKLLNMIVYVLTRAVRLEHTLIYILDERKKVYVLGASKRRIGHSQFSDIVEQDSVLVSYLSKHHLAIVYEEVKQKVQDYQDVELLEIEKTMSSFEAALVIPIFVDQKLTAIVAMGKKESGRIYNEDDLSVFTILANQAALAIENAQFYEDMKLTQEQLFQAEKMATIGTMADGLSHQINNRFHALGFISGDALDTIKMVKEKGVPDNLKETFDDLERAFNRVQDNVVQGGEVVQGLLRYTRKGDEGFVAVNFEDVFKSAYEMAQFKIKTTDLKVVRMFDPLTAPKIRGNFTQLQEVFFNLIDNGYDAMMQRKTELKEPGFVPTLKVYVNALEGNQVELIFEDNGAGVKPDDMAKLFTPFFTTKLSSKKGTGLGLYVIKKIIEDNHKGQVIMDSQYMVGTKMKLRLPIAFE